MNDKIDELKVEYPLLHDISKTKQVFWINPNKNDDMLPQNYFKIEQIIDAENRLKRFSPYLKVVFPETKKLKGIIESELIELTTIKQWIENTYQFNIEGKVILKCDHDLPISGSIKARGGIYEVLKYAESIAIEKGLLQLTDDYSKLHDPLFQKLYSQYSIAVGSTGNLGLSIGIIGVKLGFQVTVHMSSDAKEWKKQLLREKGVNVIEYQADYNVAVAEGRKEAEKNPYCHFIDDENSIDLFAGYAVSSLRLKEQLDHANILVDEKHPLFVYLPCGVGGGPGGVAYGLKAIFGSNVHLFFGEPVQSPCMTIGLMTGLHDQIAVSDFGLTNTTVADGLAVGRASKFVGKVMEPIISGCYTVDDSFLFESLRHIYENEKIFMEPSAHAAVFGLISLLQNGQHYISKEQLENKMNNATHIIWSTGGSMVPNEEKEAYLRK